MGHPLDRPVWSALTSRHSHLARGDSRARRYDPDFALFAATAGLNDEALAALAPLITPDGVIGLVEALPVAPPEGTVLMFHRPLVQMAAAAIAPDQVHFDVTTLTDADAPDMLALATLTEPGPFFRRTHQLGDFIGVKIDGRLVAMAGERMKMPGFAEISGVCTHPDHRGKGYAGGLMRILAARMAKRGEVPFLHVWADNAGAIALYESLGYQPRRELVVTALGRTGS